MNINPSQKTTRLGTALTFEVVDMRGRNGFPQGQKGLAFRHQERRTIYCGVSGLAIKRSADFILRTDAKGWRIDHREGYGLNTAVYGPNGEEYFPSNDEAAFALQQYLDDIRDNSTLTGRLAA
jgi:hypothetical protein